MYRDPGVLPYAPLLRRPAWIFRCIAVAIGAVLAVLGVLFCALVMLAAVTAYLPRDALMSLTLAPFCVFGTVYGADLSRRALVALSTHRSAFDGRHGKKRSIVAGVFGGYALLWSAIVACALDRIAPGMETLLLVVAMVGLVALGAFVHGVRRRSRLDLLRPSPLDA